jgi:hypothetical protein
MENLIHDLDNYSTRDWDFLDQSNIAARVFLLRLSAFNCILCITIYFT